MKMRIIFLACLCVVAKVHAVDLGVTCTTDTDCTVTNSKCTGAAGSMTCTCDDGYLADGTTACKAKIDTGCTGTGAQNCITNAECTNDACSCKNGYKAAANMETCTVIYDTTCTNNDGCAGLAESECSGAAGNMKCKCKSGYKHVAPACVAKVINDACTAKAECSAVSHSDCTGAANAMTCKCDNGYKANANLDACVKVYDTACTVEADCSMLKYGTCTGTPMKCMCVTATAVMESNICKLKAGGTCSTGDICPSNSACTGGKCTCSGDYEADTTTNLCKAKNGSGMTVASVMLIVTALATVLLR